MFQRIKEIFTGHPCEEDVHIVFEPTKGDLLNACRNDAERYQLCIQWAEKARDDYFRGEQDCIADVLLSRSPRFRGYNAKVRRAIGVQRWSKSAKSKELAAAEQMYSRWAQQYKGGPESRSF